MPYTGTFFGEEPPSTQRGGGGGRYGRLGDMSNLPRSLGVQTSDPNWLTDPEQPWNLWAQDLEGLIQQWVTSQKQGLQADVSMATEQAGRQAVGQGLYTGTYTTSLPTEYLGRKTAEINRGYAGALANLQGTGLEQLMSGQQKYGSQMLEALMANMDREAWAKAQEYGWGNFFGDLFGAAGSAIPLIPGIGGG